MWMTRRPIAQSISRCRSAQSLFHVLADRHHRYPTASQRQSSVGQLPRILGSLPMKFINTSDSHHDPTRPADTASPSRKPKNFIARSSSATSREYVTYPREITASSNRAISRTAGSVPGFLRQYLNNPPVPEPKEILGKMQDPLTQNAAIRGSDGRSRFKKCQRVETVISGSSVGLALFDQRAQTSCDLRVLYNWLRKMSMES